MAVPELPTEFAALSPRERECLLLMARGLTNKQIAREMFVSGETVKNWLTSAYARVPESRIGNPRVACVLRLARAGYPL